MSGPNIEGPATRLLVYPAIVGAFLAFRDMLVYFLSVGRAAKRRRTMPPGAASGRRTSVQRFLALLRTRSLMQQRSRLHSIVDLGTGIICASHLALSTSMTYRMGLRCLVSWGGAMRGSVYLVTAHTPLATWEAAVDRTKALHGFTRLRRREGLDSHDSQPQLVRIGWEFLCQQRINEPKSRSTRIGCAC